MVEASKLWFERTCSGCECNDLIHPWTYTCTDATKTMLLSCIKGSYKFYAAVYLICCQSWKVLRLGRNSKRCGTKLRKSLAEKGGGNATGMGCGPPDLSLTIHNMIQILMRGKKLGKKEIIQQFKLYLKSGIFGLTVGSSFVTLNCIFRNLLFTRFHYYGAVLLPCTVSGLAVYFEPPHRRILVVNLFVNLVFEYWLRTLEMKGWLRRSPGRETLIFMLGSAIFFYLMRKERENPKRTPILWFFSPPKVTKEIGEPITGISGRSPACPHKGTCMNYVLRGTAQLFGVGCIMTMLRTLIPKLLTPAKALRSLNLSHMKLGLFFGGYIGLYRLIVCLLCRANGRDSALYAIPAGFLAGTAFRAAPSTPIALAPITSILQIFGSWAYQRGMIPENLPLIELLYCVCQGLLFHARVMHEDVCPKYIINLMRTVTSAKADEIQSAFIQKMLRSL